MGPAPSMVEKKTRDALIFVVAHVAFAVICMWLAPSTRENIPAPIEWWGGIVDALIPNVSGWSSLTNFAPAAWFTLVILWTLLPLSVWWAARGDWVFEQPNRELFRRRPSILVVFAILMVVIVAYIAFHVPELREPGYGSRSSRTVRSAVSSPTAFGIYAGLALAISAMCLGVLPRFVQLWREATGRDR